MAKLDRKREFGVFFEGQLSYNSQDGKLFSMADDEEVPQKAAAATGSTIEHLECKKCGKKFKLGDTDASRSRAATAMRKHIEKEHPELMTNE